MNQQHMLLIGVALVILVLGYVFISGYFNPQCNADSGQVCGDDGKTYDSECAALDAGVEIASEGKCKAACQDSDNGKDLFVTGNIGTSFDSCVDSNTVKEFYCDAGKAVSANLDCPAGYSCDSGKCVEDVISTVTCDDSDAGLAYGTPGTVVVGSASYNDVCRDSSTLTEYHCVNNVAKTKSYDCPSGYTCSNGRCTTQVCSDTETGSVLYSIGTATLINGSGMFSYPDTCVDSAKVKEYSCDGVELKVDTVDCPSGYSCSGGVCYSPSGCYDTDGSGTSGRYTIGTVYYNYDAYTDYCSSGNSVVEYACSGGTLTHSTVICPSDYECSSGRCRPIDDCDDSDDGIDYYERGTVEYGTADEQDYCLDSDTLREYFCDGDDDIDSEVFNCPSDYLCRSGRCARESSSSSDECSHDGDCDLGEICVSGDCVVEPSEDECDVDADCDAGYVCSGHTCVDEDAEVICTDPDGNDRHTRTTVTLSDGSDTKTDACAGNTLTEYVCALDGVDGYIDNSIFDCAAPVYGEVCYFGACRAPCSETDAYGIPDQNHVGTTSFYTSSKTDQCFDGNTVSEWYCTSPTSMTSANIDCAAGYICSAGQCIVGVAPPAICTDPDEGADDAFTGTTTTSTDGTSGTDNCVAGILWEYECDGTTVDSRMVACTAFGSYFECGDGNSDGADECMAYCDDSDADTFNPYIVRGTVNYGDDSPKVDYCKTATQLIERICGAGGTPSTESFDCASVGGVCSVDKCVEEEVEVTCSDPDGNDRNTKGTTTLSDGSDSATDSCSGNTLTEYTCSGGAVTPGSINCATYSDVCYDGHCTDPCSDSDDGEAMSGRYVSGITIFDGITHRDSCTGANVLEWYCVDTKTTGSFALVCPVGCVETAISAECITPECTVDDDCDFNDYCNDNECVPICVDSDGGLLARTVGHTTIRGVAEDTDTCISDERIDEYICDDRLSVGISTPCGNGYACFEYLKGDACAPACQDTDGSSKLTKGTVYYGSSSYVDSCKTSTSVKENICTDGEPDITYLTCSAGWSCSDDRCIPS